MMQFPLLKMQHYQLIVGKLHSTLQISEVSVLRELSKTMFSMLLIIIIKIWFVSDLKIGW